jgi:hypothetical protein
MVATFLSLGLGLVKYGVGTVAPPYVAPDEDPMLPPTGAPEEPVDTPTDPDTGNPEPGIDPDYVEPTRIEVTGQKQTAIRTTADPGTWGNAYIATTADGYDYWEIHIATSTPKNATLAVGITNLDLALNGIPGDEAETLAYWSSGVTRTGGVDTSGFPTFGRGDKIMIARDNDTGNIWFGKNGTWLGSTPAVAGSGHQGTLTGSGPYYPFVGLYSTGAQASFKFASSKFAYSVPTGFHPLGRTTSGPVATDGATVPWIGGGLTSPAIYDATLGKTFMSWEAWAGVRSQQTTSYDHSTGYFSDIEGMGVSLLEDDDHGTPALVLDHEDYLHSFYGAHGDTPPTPVGMKHSVTRWPIDGAEVDGSHWSIAAPIAGSYTYPRAIMVSSTMYLFMRKTITASTKHTLVLYQTSALSGGAATWGSEATLVDFEADSRFYLGAALLNGTDIWLVATRADNADAARKGVYVFILDTTDGSIRNYDGSTDTASGSLPITNTLANSDYRIFDHSTNRGDLPAACFDTSGNLHICFLDGMGTSYALKHVSIASGVLSSTTTIATIKAGTGTGGFVEVIALVQLASGEIELWYPEDEAEAFDHGGNMTRRVRSSGGTWGSAETVLEADTNAVARPSPVVDGVALARVVFTEILQASTDPASGALNVYLWGSSGLVGYQQVPAASITSTADGVELREDGTAELREDASDELREVVI